MQSKCLDYHVNIMAWDAVPQESKTSPGAIAMAGGHLTQGRVLSLAVNSDLLCSIMVKGSQSERENLFEVACRFLENRNPGLDLDHTTYVMDRGSECAGDVDEVTQKFVNKHTTPSSVRNEVVFLHLFVNFDVKLMHTGCRARTSQDTDDQRLGQPCTQQYCNG